MLAAPPAARLSTEHYSLKAEVMLHDLRGSYIRREEDAFRDRSLNLLEATGIALIMALVSLIILVASLNYGVPLTDAEPSAFLGP